MSVPPDPTPWQPPSAPQPGGGGRGPMPWQPPPAPQPGGGGPMPWQPPPGRGGRGPAVAVVSIAVALAVACVAGAFVVWALVPSAAERVTATPVSTAPRSSTDPGPSTDPGHESGTTGPGSPAASAGSPSVSAGSPAAPAGGAEPVLRDVAARRVVGPSFTSGDDTYTMAFKGWPFAFRTPHTWGCLAGKDDDDPQAKGWVCVDEGNAKAGQRLIIVYRQCPPGCTAQRRKTMVDGWFDTDVTLRTGTPDSRTGYAESTTAAGQYQLVAARVSGDDPRLLVAVKATSPKSTRATVQKIVNDVVTQAP